MSSQNLVLNEETSCCGIHVITCAKFIALVGIFSALFSIISAIFLWYYIPFAFVSFLIYAYVLSGIQLERPSLLLPAIIILSINFVLNIFTVIALIIIGSIAPLSIAQSYAADSDGDIQRARAIIRAAYLITAAIVAISTIYNGFALTVIQKARRFMIESSRMPSSFTSTELPSTFMAPNTVPPSFAPKPTIPQQQQQQPPPPPPYSETL